MWTHPKVRTILNEDCRLGNRTLKIVLKLKLTIEFGSDELHRL